MVMAEHEVLCGREIYFQFLSIHEYVVGRPPRIEQEAPLPDLHPCGKTPLPLSTTTVGGVRGENGHGYMIIEHVLRLRGHGHCEK